jgi:demethylmenaquinone methyltransferase/2-methoxy-6-polyprenyl-1,4-benzoquinol methylase
VAAGIERGLSLLGSLSGLSIVDLGCGTGRLEAQLLPRIGEGSITAIDFSPAMIEKAALRCPDPRVTWLCRDVRETGLASSSAGLVLCFDAFPHFPDSHDVLAEVVRWLRPGGAFLLWHDVGRERLAEIHRRAGPPVDEDLLPPMSELSELASRAGFVIERAEEDSTSYTFLARVSG